MTADNVVAALKERPWGANLMVSRDLDVNLEEPEGYRREEDIAVALTMAGLKEMLDHFLLQQHPWCREGRTWNMVQAGREVSSRTDYILGKYCVFFRNVTVWYPQHN